MGIFSRKRRPEDQTGSTSRIVSEETSTSRPFEPFGSAHVEESSNLRHQDLGLSDAQAVDMYKQMLLARVVDQKMFALNRMGRAPFMVSVQGHEAAQVAAVQGLVPGTDIILPYYRDLALMLGLGMTPYEAFLGLFAKASDPSSGGRQMPNHWGYPRLNVITGSSPIATHLPHAAGLAYEAKIHSKDHVIFASFGDGATSKGDFHEACNFAGIHKLPIIFFCENNGFAISVPLEKESAVSDISLRAVSYNFPGESVDGTDLFAVYDAVSRARKRASAGEGPTLIVAKCHRFLAHTSDDDDRTYRSPQELADQRTHDPLTKAEEYLKAARLITESDIETWKEEYKALIDAESSRADSELSPEPESVTRGVLAPFDQPAESVLSAEDIESGKVVNLLESVLQVQDQLLQDDPRVIILGEDVGRRGGVFRATVGLLDKYGEDRVLDTPLAESSIVGIGIGLALAGMRPIVEIQFADFIHSAFDQILSEAALIHYRSNGAFNVPLVIRTPYGGGIHGALYHSQSIESFYAHIPGMKVVIPSTPSDLVGLMRSALDDPNPVLFLEHKKAYRLVKGTMPAGKEFRIPIGKGTIVRPGKDLSIITYGLHRHYAEAAAEALSDRADIEVLDLRTISPLDTELILDSATRCSRVLIVHEDNLSFGVGAEISALIAEHAFWALDAPISRLAMPDVPAMGFASSLEEALTISTDKIQKAAAELLAI